MIVLRSNLYDPCPSRWLYPSASHGSIGLAFFKLHLCSRSLVTHYRLVWAVWAFSFRSTPPSILLLSHVFYVLSSRRLHLVVGCSTIKLTSKVQKIRGLEFWDWKRELINWGKRRSNDRGRQQHLLWEKKMVAVGEGVSKVAIQQGWKFGWNFEIWKYREKEERI